MAPGPASTTSVIPQLLSGLPTEPPPGETAGAAVLIVLRDGLRGIETLLIERAVREGDPASGHVALPGGRVDAKDTSLRATALREIEEEVGLTQADLTDMPRYVTTEDASLFSLRVSIFAGQLGPRSAPPLVRSPREVAHVFWLPSDALRNIVQVPRETPQGPREVSAVVFEGHVLWGFTQRVLREFFARTRGEGPDAG